MPLQLLAIDPGTDGQHCPALLIRRHRRPALPRAAGNCGRRIGAGGWPVADRAWRDYRQDSTTYEGDHPAGAHGGGTCGLWS